MATHYPEEFREDVVAVPQRREPGVTLKQIAEDSGGSDASLSNWLRQADSEDGKRLGLTDSDQAENRELRKRVRLLEREDEVLRRAAAYVSQANLKLGGNPRQPYYRWKNTPVGDAMWVRAHRVNALFDAHGEDPTFGYRFLADEARRAGWRISRRTAWKLCSDAGVLSSAQRRRRGKGRKAGPPVFDDLVKRQFRAGAPNRLWITDITEHWTGGHAVLLLDERRLREPDCRLLDLGSDDREARR